MKKVSYASSQRRSMANRPADSRRPAIHKQFITPAGLERKSRQSLSGMPQDEPAEFARDAVSSKIEAILMLADEPIASRKIAEVAGLADGHEARRQIEKLKQLLEAEHSPFTISELAGGFQLLTKPNYQSWLLRLRRFHHTNPQTQNKTFAEAGHDLRLTPAALETLAVIAYKQPVMRAEVESIRGVGCNEMIHLLMEKGLVRISGRHDSLGRPQLFGTTKKFLQIFGFNTLDDMPQSEMFKRVK